MKQSLMALFLAALLAGCSCREVGDMERLAQHDLSTPENALEYFKEALLQDSARHQYLVFSQALKDYLREQGHVLSLANYVLVREDMQAEIVNKIGQVENIRVGEVYYSEESPDLADVELISRTHRERVKMIQEISYDVFLTDDRPLSGFLPHKSNPASIRDGILHLTIPLEERPQESDPEIYRLKYFREWKILQLPDSKIFREMGTFLERRLKEKKEPPPPDI